MQRKLQCALPRQSSQSHRSNRLHSAVTRMDVSVFSPSMCRAVNCTQDPCEMPCSNAGLATRKVCVVNGSLARGSSFSRTCVVLPPASAYTDTSRARV